MRLKLKDLKRVAERTVADERASDSLREEVLKAFGSTIVEHPSLVRLAESANDRLDVLERTGRAGVLTMKQSTLLRLAANKNAEVRRLAVRLMPEHLAVRLKDDPDAYVRHCVAKKAPLSVLREMYKSAPWDDELRTLIREAGVPNPKKQKKDDNEPKKRLGDSVKQQPGPELSDQWYDTMAHNAISDYNSNIEGQWDEPWAHRYCASVKATSGVEVDEKKLLDKIQKQLKDKDDRALERYSLKEVAKHLRESHEYDEPVNIASDVIDEVADLMASQLSTGEFLKRAAAVFSVRESVMPAALRKYRVTEGMTADVRVPCLGKVPGDGRITHLVERALDTFVERWNEAQARFGEPIRIGWALNPNAVGLISFKAELK